MSNPGHAGTALGAAVLAAVSLVGPAVEGEGPSAPPPPSAAGWWRTDLSAVPLGTAEDDNPTGTALARQWSHYGQGQEDDYGRPSVVSARADGLPAPPAGGDHTIRLRHSPGDTATHRKLYKSFSADSWPVGTEPFSQQDGSPKDVSGRYIVYQYISSAELRLTERGWINLVQLKEGYATSDGNHTSDPSWWLVAYNRDGRQFLDLAHWGEGRFSEPLLDLAPYLDRWVKVEMRVYQQDRVEIYLDDKLVDVGRQSQYPVGRMHYIGGKVGDVTVTEEQGWIFGAGNYSNPSDPESGSLVHVGPAAVLPLP